VNTAAVVTIITCRITDDKISQQQQDQVNVLDVAAFVAQTNVGDIFEAGRALANTAQTSVKFNR
jgi:hypothetical protein